MALYVQHLYDRRILHTTLICLYGCVYMYNIQEDIVIICMSLCKWIYGGMFCKMYGLLTSSFHEHRCASSEAAVKVEYIYIYFLYIIMHTGFAVVS